MNTPSYGRGPHGNRTKANQGRGRHNTKYSSPKLLSASTQVHGLIRIQGGSPADMDLSADRDDKSHESTNRLKYKGASPWAPPPPSQRSRCYCLSRCCRPKRSPKVHHFVGTINLGFAVPESKKGIINVSLLLKRIMSNAKQTDHEFFLEPLNSSGQYITNPSNIPSSKDGIELYYQHRVDADGIRGKVNVTMSSIMGELKDMSTPFRNYLNQDKVYVSLAVIGLVNTRIIGIMLQTDPLLTFRDDIKASIMDIMNDNTPMSIFSKRVSEVTPTNDNPRFTNGLAIQIAIKDG
jgi:hypothetical protein